MKRAEMRNILTKGSNTEIGEQGPSGQHLELSLKIYETIHFSKASSFHHITNVVVGFRIKHWPNAGLLNGIKSSEILAWDNFWIEDTKLIS